ncbi:MAG: Sir2 family NAD-dependent protein deacetylase [Campylobacterota bacterium]|nr:Sir2 family NAD-dependent protein deacetylase [Campylobacterota bacterium]
MAKVVILSGAGISAESGICTFRESDGLWENHDVSVVCNYDSLEKNEAVTIKFYDQRRANIKDKVPNKAHKTIAALKEKYKDDIAVMTQNIDDLFEKAGIKSEDLIHLHGFLKELRCRNSTCGNIVNIGYEKQKEANGGICAKCGEKLRPNIVFFGETAPKYEELNHHIEDCEMFVVIGTSGNVVGVNTIASFADISILNNLEPSSAIDESVFNKVIYDKATVAIDDISKEIEQFLA